VESLLNLLEERRAKAKRQGKDRAELCQISPAS
jgi:hypothetical protein